MAIWWVKTWKIFQNWIIQITDIYRNIHCKKCLGFPSQQFSNVILISDHCAPVRFDAVIISIFLCVLFTSLVWPQLCSDKEQSQLNVNVFEMWIIFFLAPFFCYTEKGGKLLSCWKYPLNTSKNTSKISLTQEKQCFWILEDPMKFF